MGIAVSPRHVAVGTRGTIIRAPGTGVRDSNQAEIWLAPPPSGDLNSLEAIVSDGRATERHGVNGLLKVPCLVPL